MLAILLTAGLTWALPSAIVLSVIYAAYFYFVAGRHLKHVPGPFLAKFTGAWLAWGAYKGDISQRTHNAHIKYGKFVRLQPNHVSINDDAAVSLIYGHSSKLIKSELYDSFQISAPNVFTSRSKPEHARKRRFLSHAFSAQALQQFEPCVAQHIHTLLGQLEKQRDLHATTTATGVVVDGPMDILPWFNYQTFDVISDLAFGRSLNMLPRGCDLAEMKLSPDGPTEFHPAIAPIAARGFATPVIGMFPSLKILGLLPLPTILSNFNKEGKKLFGLALACVTQRLEASGPSDRKDILYRMIEGADEKGESLTTLEMAAEAVAMLVAGSDTTAHTLALFSYYLARHPDIQAKLQKEIDAAVPEDVEVPEPATLQTLPYLDACLKETLRLHSLVGMGLPREIPLQAQGLHIDGHFLPPGTVVSVPLHSIHHSTEIWGPDVEEYKPERWESPTPRQKAALTPFQIGPRGCVGRSLAELELRVTMSSVLKKFNLRPGQTSLDLHEGFLRKSESMKVILEKRVRH